MAEKKKYDIFISYRRVDSLGKVSGRDIARTLQKELQIRGYNVFFDYSERPSKGLPKNGKIKL